MTNRKKYKFLIITSFENRIDLSDLFVYELITKKQIVSVRIINKNGTSNTITVKNFVANSEMADSVFTFNKESFKGVEEVDLRDN